MKTAQLGSYMAFRRVCIRMSMSLNLSSLRIEADPLTWFQWPWPLPCPLPLTAGRLIYYCLYLPNGRLIYPRPN